MIIASRTMFVYDQGMVPGMMFRKSAASSSVPISDDAGWL
ncbi:hypothetical protein BJB45_07295 [Halomonas huangheensis]|uniref:Uncharacterized protein n=1 Tax=Halomonas huangheensis TaxID=1178482 RepID=W1N283_9GAMM|nr:hypothetical protein BJB45_07295 [Halomonas huangheensis]